MTINKLIQARVISKQNLSKLLPHMLPYWLYPNNKIRFFVCQLISSLVVAPAPAANSKEKSSKGKPFYSSDEFYCFVRPFIKSYLKEQNLSVMKGFLDP